MKITYFTNAYPAISQTFIRRELHELERMGYDIQRVALRTRDRLVDRSDVEEAERTIRLFSMPKRRFAGLAARWFVRHPLRVLATVAFAARATVRQAILPDRMAAYLLEASALAELCNRHGSRLVRVHFGTNGAMVCRLAKRMGGPDYSVAFHGPDEFDAPTKWDIGGLVDESAFVTAITSFCRSQIFRWTNPAAWNRVHVVRCGIDLEFFRHEPLSHQEYRRLCVVCRLAPQKGLPLLISALAISVKQGANLVLEIVGDGDMRLTIEREVESQGLTEKVKFHGSLDGAGVRGVLAASDGLIMPSFAEGLPVVIMEAMAVGRPVIATAIAGIPELVVAGETGWIAPAGDTAALARCMVDFANCEASVLEEMGRKSRERVSESHDIRHEASVLHDAIQHWLKVV